MAPLPIARHEAFARLIFESAKNGMSHSQCYEAAGYTCRTPRVANAAAARLLANVRIRARIAELQAPVIRKSQVTLASLVADVQQTVAEARAAEQHGAVNAAHALIGKLTGLLKERAEIEIGPPGSFANAWTTEEIGRKMVDDYGLEAARDFHRMMGEILDAIAAERAEPLN